jgi:hypothetical protein
VAAGLDPPDINWGVGVLEIDTLHRASVSPSITSLSSISSLVLVILSLPFLVVLLVISSLTFLVAQPVIIGSYLLVYNHPWCSIDIRLSSPFAGSLFPSRRREPTGIERSMGSVEL